MFKKFFIEKLAGINILLELLVRALCLYDTYVRD